MQGHLDEFRPNLSQEKEKIRAFGIKKELYRPFQEGLSCLALYYNLQENNTFARINELHKLQVFSAKGAENLKEAIARVLSLRFEAHHFYQEEQEYLCHPEEGKPLDPTLLYVNETHLEALHAIYRILLPFHKSMEAFFRTKDKKTLKSDFYEEGPAVQAQVFEKTLQYRKAQEAYQQAVALDPNDVNALLYLGRINDTLGNSKEAMERAQQALKIAIQKNGEEHPDVATCLNNLGAAWEALGDAQKAITYYERALAIDEKTYGKDHPHVAISLNNLGAAWKDLGDAKKAITYYERALAIDEKTYGKDHPQVAIYLNNLGSAWDALGDAKKAITYYERALAIVEKTYGKDHPGVAISLNNLGSAWKVLGDAKKAITYY